MCGIFGLYNYMGKSSTEDSDLIDISISCIESLEYRGYDSCGAGFFGTKTSFVVKSLGSVLNLRKKINFLNKKNLNIKSAICHTRWATHGKVALQNSHPIESRYVAIVHNGIISNYYDLRSELKNKYTFKTQTDSEVISALIYDYKKNGYDNIKSFELATSKLQGTFAIICIFKDDPNKIFFAANKAPLLIGNHKASGLFSFSSSNEPIFLLSQKMDKESKLKICRIHDNSFGFVEGNKIFIYKISESNDKLIPKWSTFHSTSDKNKTINNLIYKEYGISQNDHYMLKEIYQQIYIIDENISLIQNCIKSNGFLGNEIINTKTYNFLKNANVQKVYMIGNGTSSHALSVISSVFNEHQILSYSYISSDFLDLHITKKELNNAIVLLASQSGETMDVIKIIDQLKKKGIKKFISITNNKLSSISNMSNYNLNLNCGTEISVAATKTFSGEILYGCFLLDLFLQKKEVNCRILEKIEGSVKLIKKLMHDDNFLASVQLIAEKISKFKNVFVLSSKSKYHICQEMALKIKEICYIHAEPMNIAEIKHGPMAMIDSKLFNLFLINNYNASTCKYYVSAVQEVYARTKNSNISIICCDKMKSDLVSSGIPENVILSNESENDIDCLFVDTIIAQMISYYAAKKMGRSIDKPRNLAKTITV